MDKLEALMVRCKCGVFLTVNEHRGDYNTAAQALDEAKGYECPPEIEPAVEARMIETDTIVRLQFYPDTPTGSYEIWHYDLDAALDEALACLTPNAPHEGPAGVASSPKGRARTYVTTTRMLLFANVISEMVRAEEREACATACDRQAQLQMDTGSDDCCIAQANRCARDIRMRSNAKLTGAARRERETNP